MAAAALDESVYEFTPTDPTIPISGRGNRHLDVRELVWEPTDEGERLASLRAQARAALVAAMPGREPTERDLNMLDHHLELAIQAASGDKRGLGFNETAYFDVGSETGRFCMPHYGMDESNGEQVRLLQRRYNVQNLGPVTQTRGSSMRPPEEMAVKIAVARTLPFTAISKRDDDLFLSEDWRRHTHGDVVTAAADAVPTFVPPIPSMPHHKLARGTENARFDQVTDQPLYPDGHPAWFRGWDQFFDSEDPFPPEMA